MRRFPCSLPFIALLGAAACIPPAVVPTRPTERLPRVQVEIHNTPTQSDDYVGATAATAADGRIRIIQDPNVTANVPVTLKNLSFQTAPALRFAAAGTPTLASLNLTLPTTGAWVPFRVAGAAGAASVRDKDAVIEVLESRPDGIVLGRKALMVAATAPVAAASPDIIIEVGQPPIVDDYLTWRPLGASVRLAQPATADVAVTVRNMGTPTVGQLQFGVYTFTTPVAPPAMAGTLALTLPADGSAVGFAVSGAFGFPSRNDKDAVIEVVQTSDDAVLGREGTMVRVRKNAAVLNNDERDRFLHAVARANDAVLNEYLTYQQIHGVASQQAHGGPAFLAWHRAFVLRLERAMQAIDPAVALHYWRFDAAAPTVFASNFMGGPGSGGAAAITAPNPLVAWSIQGFSGIQRSPAFTPAQAPPSVGNSMRNETQTLALGGPTNTYALFTSSESNPHDQAHIKAGNGGWLNFVNIAVRDPLFFMLHSNVERLWAKWQWVNGRKVSGDPDSYAPQGAYPASGTVKLGQYANDRMWPWDGTTGQQVSGDPNTVRPATAPGGPIPAAVGGWAPPGMPRPNELVNFDQWALLGMPGLGYAYDDVGFSYVP
jgi:tyrosinase